MINLSRNKRGDCAMAMPSAQQCLSARLCPSALQV
jgi:hypothetical protein